MLVRENLEERSGAACELCGWDQSLVVYDVAPYGASVDTCILVCQDCHEKLHGIKNTDPNYWRCLNISMWSPFPAVQVVVWRILDKFRGEGWPQDLLDALHMDDETLRWAKSMTDEPMADDKIIHQDSNGNVLQAGDSVVLIKDLDVKGGGFTAKRGTSVRGISLVEDNSSQIEGRVNGQQIVILTQYVKKVT